MFIKHEWDMENVHGSGESGSTIRLIVLESKQFLEETQASTKRWSLEVASDDPK